jgi:hypothetical protein
MRTINLKMRDSPMFHHLGGQRGDHRMAKLVIPLPKQRLQEIRSCVALFSCDDELVLSPPIVHGDSGDCYIKDGKVHIVLWQRLTQCWVLRVQLECYGDTEGRDFLARSAISEPVVFGKSLTDTIHMDFLPEPKAITDLLDAMHRHGNKTVLEELGDLAGDLTYNGEAVAADALTNTEINSLINQALAAIKGV